MCEAPHSVIAEYTRGARVGPMFFDESTCDGCKFKRPDIGDAQKLAMADLPADQLAAVDVGDVVPAQFQVADPKPPEAEKLFAVPACSSRAYSSQRCRRV